MKNDELIPQGAMRPELPLAFKKVGAKLTRHFPKSEKVTSRSSFVIKGPLAVILWQFLRHNKEFRDDFNLGAKSKHWKSNPGKVRQAVLARLQERWSISGLEALSLSDAFPGVDFQIVRHRVRIYEDTSQLKRELRLLEKINASIQWERQFRWIRVPLRAHPMEVMRELKSANRVTSKTRPVEILQQAFVLAYMGSSKEQLQKSYSDLKVTEWGSFETFFRGKVEIRKQAKKNAQKFAELLAKAYP